MPFAVLLLVRCSEHETNLATVILHMRWCKAKFAYWRNPIIMEHNEVHWAVKTANIQLNRQKIGLTICEIGYKIQVPRHALRPDWDCSQFECLHCSLQPSLPSENDLWLVSLNVRHSLSPLIMARDSGQARELRLCLFSPSTNMFWRNYTSGSEKYCKLSVHERKLTAMM